MAKLKTITTAFNGGELSPRIKGRIDLKQYYNGCKSLKNAIVYPQGGAYKRYGTQHLFNVTSDDDYPISYTNTRCESFTFNSLEKYVVVFKGDASLYVYDVSKETPVLVARINNTEYTNDKINELSIVQSQDTMLITHYDIFPKQLIRDRTGDNVVWKLERMPLVNIPKYDFTKISGNVWDKVSLVFDGFKDGDKFTLLNDGTETSEITLNITYDGYENKNETVVLNGLSSALSGYTAVISYTKQTYDEVTYTRDSKGHKREHHTLHEWRVLGSVTLSNSTGKVLNVGTIPEGKNIFISPIGGGSVTANLENVWSDTRGYPATCTIYQGRLWFGGSKARPQTVWASKSGLYFDFNVSDPDSPLANDSLFVTLGDTSSNLITSVHGISGRLLVFTNGGVFSIKGEDNLITPTTVTSAKENSYGSKFIESKEMDNSIFYLQNDGAQLNSLDYDFNNDRFLSSPQAVLSDHLLNNPIGLAAIGAGDDYNANYLFILNKDGDCAVFNRLKQQEVSTWTPFLTSGKILSICGVYNEIYMLVERTTTINGVDGKSIHLERYHECDVFTDSYTEYNFDDATNVITLNDQTKHYKNKKLSILSNGYPITVNTDDSNTITLPFKTNKVYIGIPIDFEIETMPYNTNLQSGAIRFDRKRVYKVICDMEESLGFTINYAGRNYNVSDRKMGFRLKTPPSAMEGLKEISLFGYSKDATIKIVSDEAIPVRLRSLELKVSVTG